MQFYSRTNRLLWTKMASQGNGGPSINFLPQQQMVAALHPRDARSLMSDALTSVGVAHGNLTTKVPEPVSIGLSGNGIGMPTGTTDISSGLPFRTRYGGISRMEWPTGTTNNLLSGRKAIQAPGSMNMSRVPSMHPERMAFLNSVIPGKGAFGEGSTGIMRHLRNLKGRPWALPAAIAAGTGLLSYGLGNRRGYGTGLNDAFQAYQHNSSGLTGILRTLGNAVGLVPDYNMFRPKSASERDNLERFFAANSMSCKQAEEMCKEAIGLGMLMRGGKMVGKSVLGGLGKAWGAGLKSLGGFFNTAGEGAAARAAANGGNAAAGATRRQFGTWLGNKGTALEASSTKWHDPASAAIAARPGWTGHAARGANLVGNLATWGVAPAGLGFSAFSAMDGAMNRHDWTTQGAEMGAMQTLNSAANMTPMQRLAFLFNPNGVADSAAAQVDQALPGFSERFKSYRNGQ